ncbi:DUF1638 domain-containing protein [Desulfoferula mesophila]|uniref:DUF1638 domain-containing protein n=1 Tax=Desulfoferula mesophila TaxID=3058419 RepID=A0AAU9EFT5_9BACT|nr:hypothetical protein FAK_04800 [Desulfoferula mesophilus]
MSQKVLIACKIFEEELTTLLEREDEADRPQVVWLDAALHLDLKLLEKELRAAIDEAQSQAPDQVRVFFGRGCLPHMDELLREKGLPLCPTFNCISAFVGEDKVRELEQGNTILMTPSWVRYWPNNARRLSGWDPVDFRTGLGRYDRILVIDPGINPLSDEEILEFFDLVQVPIEVTNIDLDHFQATVRQLLA